jgi:hypothetical protein
MIASIAFLYCVPVILQANWMQETTSVIPAHPCHSREAGIHFIFIVTFFLCKKKVTKEKAPH